MKMNVDRITFEFDGTCQACGSSEVSEAVQCTLMDILYIGIPGCPECGQDYELNTLCEVKI
jgi:transcription elongation factor Elf1